MKHCMSNKLHVILSFLATIAPLVFFAFWFLLILGVSYIVEIEAEWVKRHFSQNFITFMCVSCALVSVLLTFIVMRFHKTRNKILIEEPLKIYMVNAILFPLSTFLIIKFADFLLPRNLSQGFIIFSGLFGVGAMFFVGSLLVSKSTEKIIMKAANNQIRRTVTRH